MSDHDLIQAYVEVVMAFGATENVGKANRLADYETRDLSYLNATAFL